MNKLKVVGMREGTGRLPAMKPPTKLDIIRYRYHHGCNFGSLFVLERWLKPSAFLQNAPPDRTSELAAVSMSVEKFGIRETQKAFEKRWEEALSYQVLDWLSAKACCTSIRLPIGYFTLGPKYCSGTPFEPYGEVYAHAWKAVKKLVKTLWKDEIGVLIDFHALPGGANKEEHSGTNTGKAELWSNPGYRELAISCLQFIASEISHMDGIIGLQIVNEVDYSSANMTDWYDNAIKAISSIDRTLPVYISDSWDLTATIDYVQRMDLCHRDDLCPVCIDTHVYACFSEADKACSPHQIIAKVPTQLSSLDGKDGNVVDRGAAQVIVGEYSCVMSRESWSKAGCTELSTDGKQLISEFGHAQSLRWRQRAGGSYFWTLAMDWQGGAWGFTDQVDASNITPPRNFLSSYYIIQDTITRAQQQYNLQLEQRMTEHTNYWNKTCPGELFEHWKFEEGFKIGWNDAMSFFRMKNKSCKPGGGDRIGMIDLWVRKRIVDSGMKGKFVWEFEHGLRTGIKDFETCAEVENLPLEI